MTVKEFKHDYFSFKGRLNRKPFLMRLMMLGAISIFFVLIVINAEPHLKDPKYISVMSVIRETTPSSPVIPRESPRAFCHQRAQIAGVLGLLYSADYRQHFARRAPPARP